MMKKRFFAILCMFSLLVSAIPFSAAADSEVTVQPYEAVSYPVTADSPEWKTFQTHQEMVNATRIPKERYANATTQDLLVSALDYPLFGDIFAFNSLEEGIARVKEDCTAFELFLERDDAAFVLSNYMNHDQDTSSDSWETMLLRAVSEYFEGSGRCLV